MSTIIVAMPKIEDAKKISDMLISRGIGRIEICTSGSAILRFTGRSNCHAWYI